MKLSEVIKDESVGPFKEALEEVKKHFTPVGAAKRLAELLEGLDEDRFLEHNMSVAIMLLAARAGFVEVDI